MTALDTLELVAGVDTSGRCRLHAETLGGDRALSGIDDALERVRELVPGRRAVLWVHESAAAAWGLPGDADALVDSFEAMTKDMRSSDGWVRISPTLHVALPAYSGDFAGTATPEHLLLALATWRQLTGAAFLYSAPACALYMVDDRRLAHETPPPGVTFAGSAFSIPAHTWARPPGERERGRPFAQLFDRRGSYLAAWRSVELPDGEWIVEPGRLGLVAGVQRRAGYYLVDTAPLAPFLAAERLFDPFVRAGVDGGPVWLTAPLAVLAAELADEAAIALVAERAVFATRSVRALDRAAETLSKARAALDGDRSPIAGVVGALVKDAYTRATAHFEYGKRPGHKLYRPSWRRTIVDRHVANTYRSLRKSSERPIIVGGVDAAIFAVAPGEWPAGLRADGALGAWRRRGDAVPIESAAAAIADGRARHFLHELIEGAVDAT